MKYVRMVMVGSIIAYMSCIILPQHNPINLLVILVIAWFFFEVLLNNFSKTKK
jgi:hypothetical protein